MTAKQLVDMIARMEPTEDPDSAIAAVNRLISEAKTSSAWPAFDEERDQQLRELANDQYGRDGSVEIDDDAIISKGDEPGAYVQAWVWVEFPEGFLKA